MKIGIVTFYGVANYGAMLQAYALWKFLANRGHEVEFVNSSIYNPERMPFWRCFLSRRIGAIKTKLSNYVQQHITDFSSGYPQTRRFANIGDLRKNCPAYDVLIVGSDQVWNPKWCLNDIPIVFLDFAPKGCKRIAYAASFGVTEWGRESSANEVGRLLREFQAISVREKSGIKVVKDISGRSAECLPDPTLLWTHDFYRKLIHSSRPCSRPYVFNYVLHGWTDGVLERSCLAAVKKKTGLNFVLNDFQDVRGVCSSLYRALGIKDRVSLSEWLERIAEADFVVTNSFHGTVFSILFSRPFITPLFRGGMSGMNERVYTLLETLGLSSRMVEQESAIANAMASPIDWDDVHERLADLRKKADKFLIDGGV